MSDQTIFIMAKQRDPFARISKAMLANPKLSLRTKGLLSYLLGKPDGWKLRISELKKHNLDGERSIRAGLKEARECGYAQLVAVREGNRISEWVWKISDSPIFLDVRFAHLQNEHVQNAHPNKNECSKKARVTGRQEAPPPDGAASDLPPKEEHPARQKDIARYESREGHELAARSGREQSGGVSKTSQPNDQNGHPLPGLKSSKRARKRIAREKGEEARFARLDDEIDLRGTDKGFL